MSRRFTFTLGAALTALLVLSGCSSDTGDAEPANTPNNNSSPTDSASTPSGGSSDHTPEAAETPEAEETPDESGSSVVVKYDDQDVSDAEWHPSCTDRALYMEGQNLDSGDSFAVGIQMADGAPTKVTIDDFETGDDLAKWEAGEHGDLTEVSLDPSNVVAVGTGTNKAGESVPFEIRFNCEE